MHRESSQRFEISDDKGAVAFLSYVLADGNMVLEHTHVPEELRGQGLAAQLVREALAEARHRNWRIVPQCSYVAEFLGRHPEFSNLTVSDAAPGSIPASSPEHVQKTIS